MPVWLQWIIGIGAGTGALPKPDTAATQAEILERLKESGERNIHMALVLSAISLKAANTLRSLPEEGGGKWVNTLRKLCDFILMEIDKKGEGKDG